jgi:hypothetical protein
MTLGIPSTAGWLALSDHPATRDAESLPLPQAQFTMEIALPAAPGPVLLDLRSEDGLPRVFSVFLDRQIGLAVMQRQGTRLVRHLLRGPLPDRAGTARVSYAWDMAADRWALTLTLPQGDVLRAEGSKPMAPRLSDLQTLCKPDARRHPSVLWFGVTRGAALPDPGPWIGMATPVLTDQGLRPAGSLQPGDRIETADNGPVTLLRVHRTFAPSRGSCAPVLLRAGYFQTRGDILLSADQPVLYSGPATEYLFAEDEVLVAARHLVDGRAALWDDRRSVAVGLALDLGTPELIDCDGVLTCSHVAPALQMPRRTLDAFEAVPLMALRDSRMAIRQRI